MLKSTHDIRVHFTNVLRDQNITCLKYHFTFAVQMIVCLIHRFAHAMTALLSCHVHNCGSNGTSVSKLKKNLNFIRYGVWVSGRTSGHQWLQLDLLTSGTLGDYWRLMGGNMTDLVLKSVLLIIVLVLCMRSGGKNMSMMIFAMFEDNLYVKLLL